MKYYISKPKAHELDKKLVEGIQRTDNDAEFVANIDEADVCVFQSGWTTSRTCIKERNYTRDKHIKRAEGYVYTEEFKVKLNKGDTK